MRRIKDDTVNPDLEGDALSQHQRYSQFVTSYKATGSVYLRNRRHFECDFECEQTEEGDIIVRFFDPALIPFINELESFAYVSGTTLAGQHIKAEIMAPGPAEISTDSKGLSGFFTFYASDLTVGNVLTMPLRALKFHLVNFEFVIPLEWHFGGYDIAMSKVDRYQDAENEMNATRRPKITTELTITSPNGRIANEYEVERIAHDLCALLSLAQGCKIQWLYWDAYASDDLRVKSYHWNGKISPYSSLRIILKKPPTDINDFIQQTFEPYREANSGGVWKFDDAIDHYADTVSKTGLLELRATNLAVLVDYLTQHYADSENMTHFIEPTSFDANSSKVQKLIACSLESHFSVEDLVKNKYVSTKKKGAMRRIVNDMANMIDELNRPSFPSLLKRLLKHLDLEVDETEVKMFVTIRNKLIHDSNFLKRQDFPEGSLYESPWRQFCRILSLTSRIMLAILQYRGYFYDWKRFESAEWAGAEIGRVKMPYVGAK